MFRPLLADSGFDIVEVKIQNIPGRIKFMVTLDHLERNITIDELTKWSRAFEEALDMSGDVPRTYALDVSSPGVGHPLSYEWEFRKNVGRELKVELHPKEGEKGGKHFKAKLESIDKNELHFANGQSVTRDSIKRAKVALPW